MDKNELLKFSTFHEVCELIKFVENVLNEKGYKTEVSEYGITIYPVKDCDYWDSWSLDVNEYEEEVDEDGDLVWHLGETDSETKYYITNETIYGHPTETVGEFADKICTLVDEKVKELNIK